MAEPFEPLLPSGARNARRAAAAAAASAPFPTTLAVSALPVSGPPRSPPDLSADSGTRKGVL